MGVLAGQRARDPDAGYATTFVTQLEDVLGDCLDRGVRIVSNAGGLNPHGCAAAVRRIGARLGREVRVAVVDGDDATEPLARARAAGWPAPHLDTGEPLPAEARPGGGQRLPGLLGHRRGAGGRRRRRRHRAGDGRRRRRSGRRRGTTAGRATTGTPWPARWPPGTSSSAARRPPAATSPSSPSCRAWTGSGFPLAEVHADGSAVITKHPGTGGAVTVETVTAQLLYEVDGPRYLTPDVVARLDTMRLEAAGPDRVRLVRRPRRAGAGARQGRGDRAGRVAHQHDVRAHRRRHRGQGRRGARPRCGPASPAGGRPSTTSPSGCCAPTGPTRRR